MSELQNPRNSYANNERIQELESELNNNPVEYDLHVQYISALREEGEFEKLRSAREAMYELYPLTPAMWQEWTKDEISLNSGSDAFDAIEKLYKCGVFDYLSVSLWLEYLKFVQECDPLVCRGAPSGIQKLRNLFERALEATSLHFFEGCKVWEAYRKFEQQLLDAMDKTNIKPRGNQVQLIRSIYHRQLYVPHRGLESTLLAYKSWEAEQGTCIVVNGSNLDEIAYQKALEMLSTRAPLEDMVSKEDLNDCERLQEYMAYLKFEEYDGDPARVQILYERAIAELPISGDLWLKYTEYLDRNSKATKVVKDTYYRATRNCPWVGDLWTRYLLALERIQSSEEDISAVFEKSLTCTFSSFDEYLNIFLTRIDGLRRRISSAGEGGTTVEYALIRDTFQRASDYLSPNLNKRESLLQMYYYWARLESSLGKDIDAAREAWESLLKASGSMCEAWQGYIAMEIGAGNINKARSLYKRCNDIKFSGTSSEDMCNSWIRFEREFGTLQDLDRAVQKVTPRLVELQFFKSEQESTHIAVSAVQTNTSSKVNKKKRTWVAGDESEENPAKRQKETTPNPKKSSRVDKNQPKTSDAVNELKHSEAQVSKPESENNGKTKAFDITKSEHYIDQCTAFISNLNPKATNEDLRSFFGDDGGVVALRILKGASKGLAYVDFSDDTHLDAALAKNKRFLLGKKVSIARSDPNKGRKGGSMKHGQSQFRPRNVRPLGYTNNTNAKPDGANEVVDEQPKSNDEFRKLLLRK